MPPQAVLAEEVYGAVPPAGCGGRRNTQTRWHSSCDLINMGLLRPQRVSPCPQQYSMDPWDQEGGSSIGPSGTVADHRHSLVYWDWPHSAVLQAEGTETAGDSFATPQNPLPWRGPASPVMANEPLRPGISKGWRGGMATATLGLVTAGRPCLLEHEWLSEG